MILAFSQSKSMLNESRIFLNDTPERYRSAAWRRRKMKIRYFCDKPPWTRALYVFHFRALLKIPVQQLFSRVRVGPFRRRPSNGRVENRICVKTRISPEIETWRSCSRRSILVRANSYLALYNSLGSLHGEPFTEHFGKCLALFSSSRPRFF